VSRRAVPTLALRSTRPGGGPATVGPLLHSPLPAWAALFWNVMTFLGPTPVIPIGALGQAVAQGMLVLSLLFALLANPRRIIRPDLYLGLLSVLAVVALMVSLHNDFLVGSTYRATRFVVWLLVLWLLTPWWGRPGLPILRAHLTVLRVIAVSVIVGVIAFPGAAFGDQGRLAGALWPIPPPQVGHYGAVLLGCTVVLWFCRQVSGRTTLLTALATGYLLFASHTRTALLGGVIGLVVSGASLFLGHARVRRTAAVVAVVAGGGGLLFGTVVLSWLSRGQTAQDAAQLTGRTKVWARVFAMHRTWVGDLFGSGLSNKSFDGLPIDSNWVATFLDLGRFGVALQVVMLLGLVLLAVTRPRGPRRALALFLVTYCITASFTETGLGDASPYLLDLAVASSLLAWPPGASAD